ncbi:MAG: ribosome biogenesis GTPase Der [Candidatus Aminicenantes bacterium]|nr:ribosome biogenesis GTPase Der [Candidatus Aminicenantes bacterium]
MGRLIKVVVVGYPNVGKSTLFNRLINQKKALVHHLPGMTRDTVSAPCFLGGRQFILVDTGGFFEAMTDPLAALVKQKAWEASQDADLIIFMVDAKRGIIPGEEELYSQLKKLNKPMIVVANKVDSPQEEKKLWGDLFRWGDVLPLSAEHKRNLDQLEERILSLLPPGGQKVVSTSSLRIALVGRINVGKSSLVNRLAGEERLIVSEIPGTTRDPTDTLIRRYRKLYTLVDTAGIRKLSRTKDGREKAGIIWAQKTIQKADVVCLVLDATEFPTRQDAAIAHLAHESGKPLIIAVNKWDLLAQEVKSTIPLEKMIREKLDFVAYAPIIFVSAQTGKRVVKILDLAEEVYQQGLRKIATSQLNKFVQQFTAAYPPLSRKKRKIKLRYITQVGILPPSFLVFTPSSLSLAPSYEKFFLHKLAEHFNFKGTPVRLYLKKEPKKRRALSQKGKK